MSTAASDSLPTTPLPNMVRDRFCMMLAVMGGVLALQAIRALCESGVQELPPSSSSSSSVPAKAEESPWQFFPAFISSLSMIISSELGDKTFFIAALLSMRHGRQLVFVGAMSALVVMTVLSAALGMAVPNLLPRAYTHIGAIVLFLFFGLRLIRDSFYMTGDEALHELEEAEHDLDETESFNDETSNLIQRDLEDGVGDCQSKQPRSRWRNLLVGVLSPVVLNSFMLTFVAEWGDRSQIATIVMAADLDPSGVVLGGVIGHGICTCIAVCGGRLLASRISEKHVAFGGGVLFLVFALHSFITGTH